LMKLKKSVNSFFYDYYDYLCNSKKKKKIKK